MDYANNQQEMSLTLKYLLENPALLQPPDANSNEKGKDDCSFELPNNDLTSAYLGPQIWSDTLLSDDLKLEPVDLDELFDCTGIDDEMGDLSSLMASPKNPQTDLQRNSSSDNSSVVTYHDMPSLMSDRRSPELKTNHNPSVYFNFPSPAQCDQEKSAHQSKMKMMEMRLFDQQCAILNDILGSNQFNSQPVETIPSLPAQDNVQAPVNTFQIQVLPQCTQSMQITPSLPPVVQQTHVQPAVMTSPVVNDKLFNEVQSKPSPPVSPIEIRIPSPKSVNYVPNTTDVIISTPQDASNDTPFDPRKRAFTEEELKPQPIVRKSKKVHVPDDSKDGKYWDRRKKNNVAAKRSREARRVKENQIAMRANYLEQENSTLKTEVAELRRELTRVVELVKKYEKRYSIINGHD